MPTLADRILTDRERFLITRDFAVRVQWKSQEIAVQWFEPSETDGVLDIGFENRGPSALASASDWEDAKHGDSIVKDGVTYYLRGIEPDGEGMLWLKLSKN